MNTRSRLLRTSLVLTGLLLAACGGGGDSVVPPVLQEVILQPASMAGIECG